MNTNFRFDINGLRAYAVALVVLFHFGIIGFSGGFIGVDIFFVISGYLMTKIIILGLERENFNFWKFYLSRANRIIPALVVLCSILGAIGWFTLTPLELKDFGKHASTSLSFISNIQYYREAGYFNPTSHEKLLLHTWSLSVEWQFYIILPIFLFFIFKLRSNKNILKIIFLLFFIISLILSIYISKTNSSAAFFLLPTRAWEMLSGGLLFLFLGNLQLSKSSKYIIEYLGFSLIAISVICFTEATAWPSFNALLPVFGTFLILLAANQKSLLTNNRAVQFLGNTSYSIYLWHWPIVFYLSYFEKSNSIFYIVLSIILSIILGWLSYKFIETPSRNWLSSKKISIGYLITFIYIFIPTTIFILFFINNGYPNRLPENIQTIIQKANTKNPLFEKCQISSGTKIPECKYGHGEVKLLVIGDSHAEAMLPSIAKVLPKNSSALDWTYSGCPTVENIKKLKTPDYKCGEVVSNLIKNSSAYPKASILIINRLNVLFHGAVDGDFDISRPIRYIDQPFIAYNDKYYETMKDAYVKTLCKFSKNHTVYVTTPTPEFPVNVSKSLSHKALINSKEQLSMLRADHLQRSNISLNAINEAAEKCGIKILDTTNYFCDQKNCYPTKDGNPLYFDDDHLNIYGSDLLIPLFKTIF